MSYVAASVAVERLGISQASMGVSKRYARFYKKSEKGKNNAMFNIDGYLKYEQFMIGTIEMTRLFVEYLSKIENMTYTSISTMCKVDNGKTSSLSFGYKTALKILQVFNKLKPNLIKKFDKYYGYTK